MRRATWILWLMLALLPLRSWAVTGMGMPQGPVAAVASMSAEQSLPSAHAMPPCHQAAGIDTVTGDGLSSDGGKCQSCDWCHAALGLAPSVIPTSGSVPPDPPAALAVRDTGRAAIDGLERPPKPSHS